MADTITKIDDKTVEVTKSITNRYSKTHLLEQKEYHTTMLAEINTLLAKLDVKE